MATIDWASGVSGDFSDASDWVGDKVPDFSDDAVINPSGTYTVTISTAGDVDSVNVDAAGATLAIESTLTLGSALTATAGAVDVISSGTISGGVLSATGGAFDWSGGTLNDVKYEGTLDLSPNDSSLIVTSGGLVVTGPGGTGDGTIDLTGASSVLYLEGTQTPNNATVDLGDSDGNSLLYEDNSAAAVLTLGSGLTIDHTGKYAQINGSDVAGASIVNKGTINADLAAGQFLIDPENFTNDGLIAVSGGDTLEMEPTGFDNAGGKITVASGSALDLDCDLTTAEIGSLINSGAVAIEGTITNTGATLAIGTGSALGQLTLDSSGEINGGTISNAGAGMLFQGGTLNDVKYEGTLDLSPNDSSLIVTSGGLVVTGPGGTGDGTIDLTGASSVLYLEGTQTLNNATVDLGDSDGNSVLYEDNSAAAVLTLGSGLTIDHTGKYAQINGSDVAGASIVNKGTINADLAAGQFLIDPENFTNDGLIAVSGGDTLEMEPTGFDNAGGKITVASGSALDLDCDLTTAEIGSLINSGAVAIEGTITNTGATLAIGTGSALGQLTLDSSGEINGGTISNAGAGMLFQGGTLNDVKYEGTLDLSPNDSSLIVTSGGLVVTGPGGTGDGTIDLTGASSVLYLEGTQTPNNATVDLGDSDGNSLLYEDNSAAAVLTLGSGLTIDHTGKYAQIYGSDVAGASIVNKGTINADLAAGQFLIDPENFTNDGLIAVSGGDTLEMEPTGFDNAGGKITVASGSALDLDCDLTTAEIGSLINSGAVAIEGTITNTGATLAIGTGSALGQLTLDSSGEINGGTISNAGAGMLFQGGTLNDVKYEGTLDLSPNDSSLIVTSGGLVVTGPGGTGDGTIDLTGASSVLYLEGTQTLNNATVDLGDSDGNSVLYEDNSAAAVLTLGSGLTIDHTGKYAQINGSDVAGASIVNKGTINADLAAGQFLIDPENFTNDGLIAVSGGDTVTLDVKTVNSTDGEITVGSASTLDLESGTTLEVEGTFANAGTVTLQGDTLLLVESGGLSLTGGGTVVLEDLGADIYGVSAGTKLTNVDNTISGFGYVGQNRLTLTNEAAGVIEASGGDLTVRTAGETMVNDGAMEAADHATLLIFDTTVDQAGGGTISALTGGRVDLEDADIIGGALVGTGQLVTNAVGGVLDGRASKVSLTGALVVLNATNLTIEGSIDNAGKIDLDDVTTATDLIVGTGGATLSGGGQVNLTNRTGNIIDGVSASTTLTNVDNRIAGGGLLGDDKLILVNEAAGVIDGNTAAGLVINTGTSTITNAGEIAAGLGTVTVSSAIDNTGKLFAAGGTIVLEGAVTGAGTGEISGGTLDTAGAFNENVTFNTASGVLELAHSQTYTGTISDFSKAGGTSLDLADITFTSGVTKASYSGTATSGVLTVTNGTQTAKIKLTGDYLASKFTTASDGHGGTTVADPTAASSVSPAASAHRFIAAAASMGADVAGPMAVARDVWAVHPPMLAVPA